MADFETTTIVDDCRVWAWCITNIEEPEKCELGNNIFSFAKRMNQESAIVYFHNLKFDGSFILDYLLRTGYVWNPNKKQLEPGEFTSLISEQGVFYTITVNWFPDKYGYSSVTEFRDSLKIVTLPVVEIPKAFKLGKLKKLEIDYKAIRSKDHALTNEEKEYIKHDVIIVAKALKQMRDNGATKLTAASCALNDCKKRFGSKKFNKLFPKIPKGIDKDIRQSYKGGWTYLNPKYKNNVIYNGKVYDVNSMYPWAMKYCKLPYGEPVYFKGEYVKDNKYPLYVVQFEATFKLKKDHYPSIQLKGNMMYGETEYIEESVEPTLLTLTSVDYELFLFNYDVEILQWIGGYKFQGTSGLFDEYIDYWYNVKAQADREGNAGMKQIAKLMLNSLYGKFGARIEGRSKIPYLDIQTNSVRYIKSEEEERKGGYLPVATFITSYCRDRINRGAYECGDRFIYADTDSLHINGLEPVEGLDVDKFRLGAFKEESVFVRGKFIRQKTYLEVEQVEFTDYDGYKDYEEKLDIKCAGMPRQMKDTIEEYEFVEGAVFNHEVDPKYSPKLIPKIVPGGVILTETTFAIK